MSRLPLPAIVLLGVLVLAPTALMGFYADDYVHQLVLRGDQKGVPMKPWSLYDFGTRADWVAMDGDVGTFPWWTDDGWKVRFLRPLSSLYLWGQHALFGEWALGYHLVGLALFGVLLVLLHGLYRALGLSPTAARIGTLLFAVFDSAVLPAGWMANHNTLLATVFSVASFRVLCSGAPTFGRLYAGLLLALAAAASKESGGVTLVLAVLVLLARARESEPADRRRFGAAALVAVLLTIGYAAVLVGGGYGTASVFYATPWGDPARYAKNLLFLVAAGPVSFLGPFPLDVAGLVPAATLPLGLCGGLAGLPIWIWILRGTGSGRPVGWLVLWTLAYLVAQAGTIPSDRLMFLPGVGALGLLALFFEGRAGRPSLGVRLLFVSAVFGSGLSTLVQGFGLSAGADFLRRAAPQTEVGSPALGQRDLYVLQTESMLQAFTLHSMWGFTSQDHELTFWNLQVGNRPLQWTRVDDTTFELESLGAPFFTGAFETVYLRESPAFEVGDTWSTLDFRVEALAVDGGRPTRLRFQLERSLDADTVRFLRSEGGRLVRVDPPAIGGSIELSSPERVGPLMP